MSRQKKISAAMIARLHVMYKQRGLSREEHKAMLAQLTDGRTDKTNELTEAEANYLAGWLNGNGQEALKAKADEMQQKNLKFYRSAVLKRLQKMGINTSDWGRVNAFLSDRRIAGQPLYAMSVESMKTLIPKLEKLCEKGIQ